MKRTDKLWDNICCKI